MVKTVREIIKIIEKDGWYMDRQKGSHKQFKHRFKKGTVTITDHGKGKDLTEFEIDSILKQAALK
jgi:predicted RNA binding protein YcfA (HicA-like mRNA interferase family)